MEFLGERLTLKESMEERYRDRKDSKEEGLEENRIKGAER